MLALALTIMAGCLAGGADPADGRPNFVFILADDLGFGDVRACNPDGRIPTPHIDALAAGGMLFTDAHSGSAVCTPTRYGVLTGRYAWRSRLQKGVLGGYSPPLIEGGRSTVASFLGGLGYRTACIGKWHLGWTWARLPATPEREPANYGAMPVDYTAPIADGPLGVGFGEFFGIAASLDMPPYLYVDGDRTVGVPTVTKSFKVPARPGPAHEDFEAANVLPDLARRAVAFIEDAAAGDAPFFLYLPLNSPHTPIVPTAEFLGKSGVGEYGDFVCQTDWAVGEVVAALERRGVLERTLVVFTSDNGCSPQAGFEDLAKLGHNPNFRFRGHKADIYEGGHRVPFIASWPGRVEPGTTSDQTICLTDFYATVADLVGVEPAPAAAVDSVSIVPALDGAAAAPLREATVHHSINGSFAIREGRWKLCFCPGSGGWSDPRPDKAAKSGLPPLQLFDLVADIGETTNLVDQHPEVVDRLTGLLQSYIDRGRSTPGPKQENDVAVEFRRNR